MRGIRKIGLLSLLLVAAVFIRNAPATLTEYLPEGSYSSGDWQGSRHYYVPSDGLSGRIDFAVYDTLGGNEFVEAGFTAPGVGRYIYAYQIFNDDSPYNEAVAYFAILDIGGAPIDEAQMSGTTSQDDLHSGIAPTPTDSETPGVWVWQEFGEGLIGKGEHSWFLVFSSNSEPVPGDYDIKGTEEGELPVPAPEPGMLTLLGLSSALMFMRRRKSI